MIPPGLITTAIGKAGELLAPVAAKFASPLVKWGAVAAVVVVLMITTWWKTYDYMRTACEEERVQMIAEQARAASKNAVQDQQMGTASVQEAQQQERIITAKMDDVKKEVVAHAKKNSKPLSTATVAIYDRLIRVPNETALPVPPAYPGTGGVEIPREGLGAETALSLRDEDGYDIGLTTEDLAQAATDFAEKYALMKDAYKQLSDWNDRREKIEIDRMMNP